jgi:hypothetical protein
MGKRFIAGLFWLYVVCVVAAWSVMIVRYAQGGLITSPVDRGAGPMAILLMTTAVGFAFLFMIIAIGRYVYLDSRARGMQPVFWASVAMLVPFFIGLAGYLHARRPLPCFCPACRKEIAAESLYCGACGHYLGRECASCHAVAGEDARFCPQCGARVAEVPLSQV